MTHKMTKSMIAFLAIFLGAFVLLNSQPAQAANDSTASFVINFDRPAPDTGGGGVEPPKIPGGQEIHYQADNDNSGKLPQTGVLQSSILVLIGISLILMVFIWCQVRRRETDKEG